MLLCINPAPALVVRIHPQTVSVLHQIVARRDIFKVHKVIIVFVCPFCGERYRLGDRCIEIKGSGTMIPTLENPITTICHFGSSNGIAGTNQDSFGIFAMTVCVKGNSAYGNFLGGSQVVAGSGDGCGACTYIGQITVYIYLDYIFVAAAPSHNRHRCLQSHIRRKLIT